MTTHRAERVLYYLATALAITGTLTIGAIVIAIHHNSFVW